ncbi:cyclic nucleotide-binding domain-containing protein [bacterium]|nr:cyclic nucleotide-binding domain-containing protein [bacterium]
MIREKDRTFLQNIPFFTELNHEQLKKLFGKIVTTVHSKGAMIFKQGDESDSLYIIRHGSLDIYRGESPQDYNEHLICSLHAGHFFGEFSLIGPTTRLTTAIVSKDAHLLQLKRQDFELLAEEDPALGWLVLRAIARHVIAPFQDQPEFFFQAIRHLE